MTHEETLRTLAAEPWNIAEYRRALLAGAEALRLLPLALAGDLCGCYNARLASARRRKDCAHPDCVSVRALLATEVTVMREVLILRNDGSREYRVVHGPVYNEMVPFSLLDDVMDDDVVHYARIDYRDSGCVTDKDIPVWTADGVVPNAATLPIWVIGPHCRVTFEMSDVERIAASFDIEAEAARNAIRRYLTPEWPHAMTVSSEAVARNNQTRVTTYQATTRLLRPVPMLVKGNARD
jgi:hypothetical protein